MLSPDVSTQASSGTVTLWRPTRLYNAFQNKRMQRCSGAGSASSCSLAQATLKVQLGSRMEVLNFLPRPASAWE